MTIAELLSTFGEHLAAIWPFRVVSAWEQGVRTFCGRIQGTCTHENGLLGTGLHVFWPAVGFIQKHSSNIDIVETEDQTLTTKDGHAIEIAMSVRYKIADVAVLYANVHDQKDTIRNAVEALLGEFVPDLRWNGIQKHLLEDITPELIGMLGAWGINVEGVAIRTCVKVQALRLFGGEKHARSE